MVVAKFLKGFVLVGISLSPLVPFRRNRILLLIVTLHQRMQDPDVQESKSEKAELDAVALEKSWWTIVDLDIQVKLISCFSLPCLEMGDHT